MLLEFERVQSSATFDPGSICGFESLDEMPRVFEEQVPLWLEPQLCVGTRCCTSILRPA